MICLRQEGSLDHYDSEAKCWFKLSESETLHFIYANSSTVQSGKKSLLVYHNPVCTVKLKA